MTTAMNDTLWTAIKIKGESYLGIGLPRALKPLDLKGVHKPGFHGIIEGGDKRECSVWRITGLRKVDEDKNYLTGPLLKGSSLYDLLSTDRLTSAHLGILLTAIRNIAHYPDDEKKRWGCFDRISTTGTFFTEDGRVVLLPRELLEGVVPLQEKQINLWEEILFNPALTGEQNLLLGWSVLAYTVFNRKPPFTPGDEDIENQIRKGFYSPLDLTVPNLDSRLTDAIHRGITPGKMMTPDELLAIFNSLSGDFYIPDPDTAELEAKREKAEKEYRKRQTVYSGSTFIRKKGSMTALIAACGILISLVAYTILSGVFAPPITRDWTPEMVVETFYNSINELDTEQIDGCVTGKAGKNRVNMVTNLFAISRVRKGYEGVNPFVNAEEWYSRQARNLDEGESLYGIRNLKIDQISETMFRVSYEEWSSRYRETAEQIPTPEDLIIEGVLIEEEVELVWKREAWLISAITLKNQSDIVEAVR